MLRLLCSSTVASVLLLYSARPSTVPDPPLTAVFSRPTGQTYRTAYACEGTTLSIDCAPGNVINVIRANYGRFSITICNAHGNTEWSVNCQSPRTHRVLAERCSGVDNCSTEVNSQIFGDPCPGTHKYIEVHYACALATSTTTTTSRPRPPWFVATRPPIRILPTLNTNNTTTTLPPATTTTTTTTTSSTTTTTTTTTTIPPATIPHVSEDGDVPDIEVPTTVSGGEPTSLGSSTTPATPSTTVSSSPTTSPPTSTQAPPVAPPRTDGDYNVPWCPPTFGRGLYWNWTRGGEVAVQPCPGGASGWARRPCHSAEWAGPADLSECRSVWLATLKTRASSHDSLLSVAADLATVTASKALYGGDLTTTARLLSTLASRMTEQVRDFPDPRQRQDLVTEMLQAALATGSALLAAGMAGPWGDLAVRERRHAVTQLMVALEEASFLLADALPPGAQAAHYRSHVLVSARSATPDGSSVRFPSPEDQNLDWVYADSVILPPEAILENSDGGSTRVVFLTYRHLEDLLTPGPEPLDHRAGNISRLVNSRVVSASLGRGRHIQLPEPVTLTFTLLKRENVTRPVCAFWDYTTSAWSDEGCRVLRYNRSHVTCQCDHLTNFAVLMEEAAGGMGEDPQAALRILAYVGCVVSLVCVAGSLLVFSVFRGLASPRTAVHRHVCVCLTAAELVFLVGVWRTDAPVLCGVVAGILHYTVLSAFAWMFMEGVHVYLSVARAVECDSLRLRWWHYTLAYGLPLLVVAAAAVIDPFSYGTAHYCWLRTDNYFVFSLVGPALLLLAAHVALLAAALIYTCKLSPDDALKTKEMARLDSSRAWLRSAITLLLLMVLTWTLGLLYLHRPSLPIAAAFCVLNALHGIFIFVYYCVRNQKVREWCRSAAEREAWLPQAVRGVFAAEKQTYSPNNNNTNPHPAISHALNHALASPALNQVGSNSCRDPTTTTTTLTTSPSLTSSSSSSSSRSSPPTPVEGGPPPLNPSSSPPPHKHHHHHPRESRGVAPRPPGPPVAPMTTADSPSVSSNAVSTRRSEGVRGHHTPTCGPPSVRGHVHDGVWGLPSSGSHGPSTPRHSASVTSSPPHGHPPAHHHHHHNHHHQPSSRHP
ncbi:latrophilin Cirl isoform X4 [Procambarus clarkii]|uniref:latrophilin Cirl isoform X4 n=1 Tax=Procambarus clarkii TaxID=6728 RepID=UPI003742C4F2